jgi:hypothetical protein
MRKVLGLISVALVLAGCAGNSEPVEELAEPAVVEVAPEPEVAEEPEPESEPVEEEYDPCQEGKRGNIWVLEEADGCIDPWPLTSTRGVLMCDPLGGNLGVVVWNPDEDPLEFYAVNGMAQGQGYPPIDPFWKDAPADSLGPKVYIGGLLDAGLSLCGE